MQKADPLIRTKLRCPFIRGELVPRPRLQALIAKGLCGPLTLITAPAGFGKTTLVASGVAGSGAPLAWLSLDNEDSQITRFLTYLVAAFQSADPAIGGEAAQQIATSPQAPPEAILTSLINDLDRVDRKIVLALDDYQFINSQGVHEALTFLLEHCPKTLHLVIATRSDPPLSLARLRVRGQLVELRAADLRFSAAEAARFLNDIMGLSLDAGSVTALAERTEGWIAGLQMAALSMRDRPDVTGFIESFSGTNRYIMDYLLEEVLSGQPPEIKRFLLYTSILERLTAPLCDYLLGIDETPGPGGEESLSASQSASILERLERANLFLAPLDDERRWFRYHHLFTDLLRIQLQKALGEAGVARLQLRAAGWYERNGLVLEAIQHASMASNDEMVERLIQQNYLEMMNRGEMSWVRFWMGNLSKEMVYQRPWLCLYEALNRSWFGQLDEALLLLDEAEKRIRAGGDMLGYHAYVKSRVTAMQGDTRRAIDYCLTARKNVPADNLDLQIDFSITLGYEYFLYGDFLQAEKVLDETIRLGHFTRAINNPVAAYCLLARAQAYQGRLHTAGDLLQKAELMIRQSGGRYLGAVGLVEVETAALLCERNQLDAALLRLNGGLDHLSWWGKADDFCLAYITLARVQTALGNPAEAAEAVDKAAQLLKTCGVFSEARNVVESAQVKRWLSQGEAPAIDLWMAAVEKNFVSSDPHRFEDELACITGARVFLARRNPEVAIRWLSRLEETARASGRHGRLIEILILKALALMAIGEPAQALAALENSLAWAVPGGFLRVFLDEGRPMQMLLSQWVAQTGPGPLQDYANRLLSDFAADSQEIKIAPATDAPIVNLAQSRGLTAEDRPVEPLSGRELEVLSLIALGNPNRDIARQLVVAPGTVKAHTASIYRKLDVANRTQAVARARQLGILP